MTEALPAKIEPKISRVYICMVQRFLQETLAYCPQMGLVLGFPVAPGHESKRLADAAAIWKGHQSVPVPVIMQRGYYSPCPNRSS